MKIPVPPHNAEYGNTATGRRRSMFVGRTAFFKLNDIPSSDNITKRYPPPGSKGQEGTV